MFEILIHKFHTQSYCKQWKNKFYVVLTLKQTPLNGIKHGNSYLFRFQGINIGFPSQMVLKSTHKYLHACTCLLHTINRTHFSQHTLCICIVKEIQMFTNLIVFKLIVFLR